MQGTARRIRIRPASGTPAKAAAAGGGESFAQYLSEIRRIPMLTREEEQEISRNYRRTHDPAEAQRLVEANLRFVVRIAREYGSHGRRLADLVQEGNLGLVQAVERFDPEKGVRLVSYAATWIRARILNHILHSWSLVKIGTTTAQRRLFFSLTRTQEEMARRFDPSDEEASAKMVPLLARCFGVEPGVIEDMRRRLDRRDVSLDVTASVGEDPGIERVTSGEARQDDALEFAEEAEVDFHRVRAAMGCLDERERLVIQLRIMAETPLTLQAVGQQLGCGRERARQLEMRARKKLRSCLEGCDDRECVNRRVVPGPAGPARPPLRRVG